VAALDLNIILNIYTLAVGFTVGGVFASSFALITGNALRFEMASNQGQLSMLLGFITRIIAGPFMIIRNTFRAVLISGSEPYWIMVAIVFASLWSYCQGVLILETVCQLGACS
jgi:hypothetical protein